MTTTPTTSTMMTNIISIKAMPCISFCHRTLAPAKPPSELRSIRILFIRTIKNRREFSLRKGFKRTIGIPKVKSINPIQAGLDETTRTIFKGTRFNLTIIWNNKIDVANHVFCFVCSLCGMHRLWDESPSVLANVLSCLTFSQIFSFSQFQHWFG